MSSDHLEEPGETEGPEQAPGNGGPGHRAEAGWSIRLVAIGVLCAILIVLVFIALALYGGNRNEKAKASDQTLGDLAAQVKDACTANPVDARKVFGDVCGKAKVIDDRKPGQKGDPGPPGAAGQPGPQGVPGPAPSKTQVAAAVSSYCAGGRCSGKGPTAAQVAAAVAAYCNDKGQCKGPAGESVKGEQGEPGSNGTPGPPGPQGIQGPPGDPATGEQVAAAVSAYCGQVGDPCQGKAGAPGQQGIPGPTGPAGPDVSQQKCESMNGELQELTVTTTDPLTQAKVLVCVLK